jgi:hypothetical protein
MTDRLKPLLQFIPLFYPLLIYLGFIRYNFYYEEFDIDIFNYLNISEILFSFVPLIAPALITLTYILFAIVILYKIISSNTPRSNNLSIYFLKEISNCISSLFTTNYYSLEERIERINDYYKKSDQSKHKTKLKIKKVGKRIFRMMLLQMLLVFLFMMIFIKSLDRVYDLQTDIANYLNFIDPVILGQMLFVLTILVSFTSISIYFKKNINFAFIFFMITNSLILILFLLSNEKDKADQLYQNPLETEVSFFFEDELIISDCSKVFLGKTADYIFLRNFERKENYIFKIDDVTELRVRDLK